MKKFIFFIMLILLPSGILGHSIGWPYLQAFDYFRSTAGERIFFYYQKYQKGSFYINNDFRLYNSNKYWDESGGKHNFDKYTRLINIISIKYSPISKTQFSVRVPYVYLDYSYKYYNYQLSNSGLSDILLGVSYEIAQYLNNKIYLSSGVKIPVGYYKCIDYNERKLPLGTGSYDIPIIISSDFNVKNLFLFLDIGYIFIGSSEISYEIYYKMLLPPYFSVSLEKSIRNNGDEIFGDIAIIKELKKFAFKFEINYYYVFDSPSWEISFMSKRWDKSHYKFSINPGLIFSPKFKNIKLELGFSYDLIGKNNYSGYSPVVRIHFNK